MYTQQNIDSSSYVAESNSSNISDSNEIGDKEPDYSNIVSYNITNVLPRSDEEGSKDSNKKIYNELLEELKEQRIALDGMLETMKGFRENIDKLLPTSMDFRKKFLLEQRMDTITNVVTTELNIRRQKESFIKTEIDIRRKISGEEKESDNAAKFNDIATIAKMIEEIEGQKIPNFGK